MLRVFVAACWAAIGAASVSAQDGEAAALASDEEAATVCVRSSDGLSGACFINGIVADYEVHGDSVFFEPEAHDLTQDAQEILERQAAWLRENPNARVRLEGVAAITEHGPGSAAALALGERRANAVRDFLVAAGLAPDRIAVLSLGGLRVRDPRSTEAANAVNRSVQTVLIGETGSRSRQVIYPSTD